MLRPRIIPVLLLKGDGLVKGVNFKNYRYVGDPMNAVKIFNDKLVDELMFLDITASREKRKINLSLIEKIADECFMPFSVGGGLNSIDDIRAVLSAGAEKVSLNTFALENPNLISEAAATFGSQSVIVTIDFKKDWFKNRRVFSYSGTKKHKLQPVEWALEAEKAGAGEICLNSIARDGTMEGYEIEVIKEISEATSVPLICCGGAGSIKDLSDAIHLGHANAAAAGSMFVFHGPRRGVLINFPSDKEIEQIISGNLS